MKQWGTQIAALTTLLLCFSATHASQPPANGMAAVARYVVNAAFADVIFELNFAITERNFRITGRNTIGEGLRNRGYDDFPNIEVIHFCNLELAREVLLLDPGFVAQMPCRITVHEHAGQTVISLITLPTNHADERVNEFARRMNKTLVEIVEYAVDSAGD
jgi:uncharacterized protein (DUF302 family)